MNNSLGEVSPSLQPPTAFSATPSAGSIAARNARLKKSRASFYDARLFFVMFFSYFFKEKVTMYLSQRLTA